MTKTTDNLNVFPRVYMHSEDFTAAQISVIFDYLVETWGVEPYESVVQDSYGTSTAEYVDRYTKDSFKYWGVTEVVNGHGRTYASDDLNMFENCVRIKDWVHFLELKNQHSKQPTELPKMFGKLHFTYQTADRGIIKYKGCGVEDFCVEQDEKSVYIKYVENITKKKDGITSDLTVAHKIKVDNSLVEIYFTGNAKKKKTIVKFHNGRVASVTTLKLEKDVTTVVAAENK